MFWGRIQNISKVHVVRICKHKRCQNSTRIECVLWILILKYEESSIIKLGSLFSILFSYCRVFEQNILYIAEKWIYWKMYLLLVGIFFINKQLMFHEYIQIMHTNKSNKHQSDSAKQVTCTFRFYV